MGREWAAIIMLWGKGNLGRGRSRGASEARDWLERCRPGTQILRPLLKCHLQINKSKKNTGGRKPEAYGLFFPDGTFLSLVIMFSQSYDPRLPFLLHSVSPAVRPSPPVLPNICPLFCLCFSILCLCSISCFIVFSILGRHFISCFIVLGLFCWMQKILFCCAPNLSACILSAE